MHLDQGRNIRNIQAASLQILLKSLIKTISLPWNHAQAAASPWFSLLPTKGVSTEQLLTKGAKLGQHFGVGTSPVPQKVTEPSWSTGVTFSKVRGDAESSKGFSISPAHVQPGQSSYGVGKAPQVPLCEVCLPKPPWKCQGNFWKCDFPAFPVTVTLLVGLLQKEIWWGIKMNYSLCWKLIAAKAVPIES